MDKKTILKKVRPELRAETLTNAIETLRDKIDQQIPVYSKLPLAITATTTQGEVVLKNNPGAQEFRATVRDYASTLKEMINILDNSPESVEASALDDLRSKYRILN